MSNVALTISQAESVPDQSSLLAQDSTIVQAVSTESRRLRRFIARYVVDRAEAEDILQDVLYELVGSYRLMKPVENAGAWLVRVARNRIIDRFRKQRTRPLADAPIIDEDGEYFSWDEFLPDADAGPEEALMRETILKNIQSALINLTAAQRDVFVAHELDGQSFKEISDQTGVSVNTLLSRKHEAIHALRRQLQQIYTDL